MLRRTTDLVDLGKLAVDDVGDDVPRVEADPDFRSGSPRLSTRRTSSRAAWQASGAWLSSAIGAPNTAASPSPNSLLTMPPNWRTAARIAVSAGSSRETASSGSSSEIRVVECTTSARRMVTNLRSLSGSSRRWRRRAAVGAPAVARVHRRLARETLHFCALAAAISRTKRPAGSPAQAYPAIVAQPDWLDKPSSGLSLYAAQPWVIAFPRNQACQPHA